MKTSRLVAKHPSTVLTFLFFVGSSTTVFAAPPAAGADQTAQAPSPGSPGGASTAASPTATEPAGSTAGTAPAGAGETMAASDGSSAMPKTGEPSPAVTEVGVERLPDSAYPQPQTRGLKYGSLWLTFHGLQWPYMPAKPGSFVVGVSGWGWVDTAYQKFSPSGDNPSIDQSKIKYWKQQGRFVARLTPTYSFEDEGFVQGQVELVGTEDQTISRSDLGGADTDDLWLRAGQWNKWDVQVGRYEGWEVFHLGMGLDQNTFERKGAVGLGESAYPIQFYGLTDNQFRPQGSAGNLAVHFYPLPILRFEALGMAGSLSGPAYATRPVGILDLGWLKLKGGVEYQKVVGQQEADRSETTSKGVGGAVQFVFEPYAEFGFNAAQGTVESQDSVGRRDLKGSFTRSSIGGFANFSNGSSKHPVMLGLGALYTRTEDQNDVLNNGVVDKYWLFQSFAALQYVAFSQLYIKLVAGYSKGHWLTAGNDPPVTFDDSMYSLRLRFSLYF